ncbi:MAG: dipeptidase [Acidobacteriota bacterium]|nr:dipeptidase [Acidobacteriota bacterium]
MSDATKDSNRLSPGARTAATHATTYYFDEVISTLADLVAFRTVAEEGVANARHPEFIRLKTFLARTAKRLALDFEDHGAAVVLGLGASNDRLGLLTHADVRPANGAAWATDPFQLDTQSEPGRLLGRGVEDDKGPIAAALYSMKALSDQGLPTGRRVELIISLTEESDWTPFREFLAGWEPPQLNIALDALYPVVSAERGTGTIHVTLPAQPSPQTSPGDLSIVSFIGGSFLSQIPAEAEAVIAGTDADRISSLSRDLINSTEGSFELETVGKTARIRALGVAAHSSTPWQGRNAITQLAAWLGTRPWSPTTAATMTRFINDCIGTNHYAERFGTVAYSHDFMGPLTLALTTLRQTDEGGLVAGINIRRPVGRSRAVVEATIRKTLDGWQKQTGTSLSYTIDIGDPYHLQSAPHIPILLDIFRFYSGRPVTGPISIGGGTQARLLPNGINFGPAMPDEPYTGHSEHEFMTVERLRLNLQMYTAVLVELSAGNTHPHVSSDR